MENPVQKNKGQNVNQDADPSDEQKGRLDSFFHLFRFIFSEVKGKNRPAAHAQPDEDGGEESHQGVGAAYRRQGVRPDKLPHHKAVGDVVKLLEQVAGDHRPGEYRHGFGDGAGRQIFLHLAGLPFIRFIHFAVRGQRNAAESRIFCGRWGRAAKQPPN